MRLLDHIGWGREDNHSDTYAITVEADALRRVFVRLHDTERHATRQLMDTSLDDAMRSTRTYANLLYQLARARGGAEA